MRRWFAVAAVVVALGYCGWVRESDARGFRRCKPIRCAPCPAPCETQVWNNCYPTGTVESAPAYESTPPAIASGGVPLSSVPNNGSATTVPLTGPAIANVPPPPVTPPTSPTVPSTAVPTTPKVDKPKGEQLVTPPKVEAKPTQPKVETRPVPTAVNNPPVTPKVEPRPRPPVRTVGKVHALLIVASDDKDAGRDHVANATIFSRLLVSGVPQDRLTIDQIIGKDVNRDNVRQKLAALPVTSSDTALVAYFGPAVYDEAAKDFTFTFPTGEGSLPRGLVRSTLLEKRPRLVVLFTDPCAERALADMPPKSPTLSGSAVALEGLLLRYRGIVDLQAAAIGETAFARGDTGGVFTLAFAQECSKLTDPTKLPSWTELFEGTRSAADAIQQDLRTAILSSENVPPAVKKVYRDQKGQTPIALTPLSEAVPVTPQTPAPEEEMARIVPPEPAANVAAPYVPPTPIAPPANPAVVRKAAEVVVNLPSDAQLFVDGRATGPGAGVRSFDTPELTVGKVYFYELKVVATRGGWMLAETRRVKVLAGETTAVEFTDRSLSRNGIVISQDASTAKK